MFEGALVEAEQITGATWTRRAMQYTLSEQFEPGYDLEGNRVRAAVLVTDGVASVGQDPCSVAQSYTDNGVLIIPVAVGTSDNLNEIEQSLSCLVNDDAVPGVVTFEGFEAAAESLFADEILPILDPLLYTAGCTNPDDPNSVAVGIPEDFVGTYGRTAWGGVTVFRIKKVRDFYVEIYCVTI